MVLKSIRCSEFVELAGIALLVACERSPRPLVRAKSLMHPEAIQPSASPHADADLSPKARPVPASAQVHCVHDSKFPIRFDVPEASAAAEVELSSGTRELVVVGDSGRHGSAIAWGIPQGPTRTLTLPLDSIASDDIEGMAWLPTGVLFTLTSSGAVRRFAPDGHGGLALQGGAYPLGPAPFSCPHLGDVNCGKNYEGLCLHAHPAGHRCAGYAASKRESALYCVVFNGDKLVVDTVRPPLRLALKPDALSDCAFGAAGGPAENVLVVTTNVYGASTSYTVDESNGALAAIDINGMPNNEVIAIDRDGSLYQFMDDSGPTSAGMRATCNGW